MSTAKVSTTVAPLRLDVISSAVFPQILSHMVSRASYSYLNPRVDQKTIQTLCACRLTCKHFDAIARPLLFQTISLGCYSTQHPERCLHRIARCLELLKINPQIAADVHTFRLFGFQFDHDNPPLITSSIDAIHQEIMCALWNNADLPEIFDQLTCLKKFMFQVHLLPVFKWADLGQGMQGAIVRLVSRPSIVSLEFTNVTALPLTLVTSSPNLSQLKVSHIDAKLTRRLIPCGEWIPPQLKGEWKVKSLEADDACSLLLSLQPTVQERLSWTGCNPQDFNGILRRSRNTLKDLTIHLRLHAGDCDIHSAAVSVKLHLDQYKSLTTFRLRINETPSPLFIGVIVSFLHTQFKIPSLTITRFRVSATHLEDFDFINAFCARPIEWHALEEAIQASFPCLEVLEIELDEMKVSGGTEWVKVFTKRVLPVITERRSVRVLLLLGTKSTNTEEVDLTGYKVDIPWYLMNSLHMSVEDD